MRWPSTTTKKLNTKTQAENSIINFEFIRIWLAVHTALNKKYFEFIFFCIIHV